MLSNETIVWLSEEQRILDKEIEKKHNLHYSKELLDKKIVAFWVELGEYANEEKSFKYWKLGAAGSRGTQLEEYIDGLHFVISIGNQIGFNFASFLQKSEKIKSNVECYLSIIDAISSFRKETSFMNFSKLLNCFLQISNVQKMTEEEIISTYKIKHAKNKQRQLENY